MMIVLRRQGDGKFVARPGSKKSYVPNIADARKFKSRKEAESEKCGNEYIDTIAWDPNP